MIPIKTYKTAQIADIIGVHPNTVRLYEQWELIPKAERQENGYRIFTDFHIAVFRLARLAYQVEIMQSGLRQTITEMIKATARGDFSSAFVHLKTYQDQIAKEQQRARESIRITEQLLAGQHVPRTHSFKRMEAAKFLGISTDTLRNWELNGLLHVKRSENGYRIYSGEDITRLKIIRTLRSAGYSLESILRMLTALECSLPSSDTIEQFLNTPGQEEDIISVCDHLLIALEHAWNNALLLKEMLHDISVTY